MKDDLELGADWPVYEPHSRIPIWVLEEAPGWPYTIYGLLSGQFGRPEAGARIAWPSYETMSDYLGGVAIRHPDTIRKHDMRALIRIGAVTVQRRNDRRGFRTSNRYIIHWKHPSERLT